MLKRPNSRGERRSCGAFSIPRADVKNICCIRCRRQFFLKEFSPLQGLVPLMLQCGHVICNSCSRIATDKPCSICDIKSKGIFDKASVLPLNIYALGLMMLNYNRPVHQTDDSEISFQQPLSLKPRQPCSLGQCSECGIQAQYRCIQCAVLFCISCFKKIHGRALQNHTKVPMLEDCSNDTLQLRTTCAEGCYLSLAYFCNDCGIAICMDCLVVRHTKHKVVDIKCKNVEQWGAFDRVCRDVTRTIGRVENLQKKIKSMALHPELQTNDQDEARITQHFVQLHGILQNVEEKLLSQVREQRNYLAKNLEGLQGQLKENHDKLQSAIQIASSVKNNFENVDLVELTRSLNKFTNIPCHLMKDPVAANQEIQFEVDRTIYDHLQEHCHITVPPVHGYSLVAKNLLPADYEIEPLPQDPFMPRSLGGSIYLQRSINSESELGLPPEQFEESILTVGSSADVRLVHIVDPFLFYVHRKSSQRKLQGLERGLATLANTSASVLTEVMLNMMCLFKATDEKGWCRGRITNINAENNRVDVFLYDYGMTELNVLISELRNIPPQYAGSASLALTCALIDVVPRDGKWHEKAIAIFTKLLQSADILNMYIGNLTGDNYYVKLSALVGQNKTDVGDTLVNLRYASRVSPHQMMRMNPNSVGTYYKDLLRLDKYEEVKVLYVESPLCIYIERINESNVQAKKKLLREMTDEYEQNPSIGHIHDPEKGFPCAARGVDGRWYRTIICEVINEATVKIFLVDYGYTLEYPCTAVKRLREKYMKIRTMAIKVSLANIVPPSGDYNDWNSDINECITHYIQETNCRVKLIALDKLDDSYFVNIYVSGNKNLAPLLVKKKLANYSVPGKPNKSTNKRFNKKEKKEDLIEFITYDMEFEELKNTDALKENQDPFKVRVLVHTVVSPDCIYVANAKCAELNTNLMSRIQDFYNTYHTSPRVDWTKYTICAAYSGIEKSFFRAKIMDVKSPEEITVFFYDIGVTEIVSAKDIQALHPKFSEIPAYVFGVKLAGILPCGGSSTWPTHSIQKLQEIITENQHAKFFISKTENSDDSTIPVELWIRQTKMDGPLAPTRIEINSINRMLVEEGVALPIKDYAMKRDKILATELELQMKKRTKAIMHYETKVKWYRNDDNLDDCVEIDVNESIPNMLPLSKDSTIEDEDSCSESSLNDTTSQSKLTAWLPPESIVADHFIALATYVDYASVVYLHSKEENGETVAFIEKKLEKRFKNCKTEKSDTEWKPNDLCIAQYHGDNKWYRAEVLRILENDMAEVQFVDYGNVEKLEIGKLKKKITLSDIPIQCTKCKVQGLIKNNDTGKFKEEELDIIHGVLVGEPCEVKILQRQEEFLIVQIILLPNSKRNQKYDLITHLTRNYNFEFKPELDNVLKSNTNSTSGDISNSSIFIDDVAKKCTDVQELCEQSIEAGSFKLNKAITANNILMDQCKNTLCNQKCLASFCKIMQKYAKYETDDETDETVGIENLSWSNVEKGIVTSTPYSPLSTENLATYNSIEIPDDLNEIEIKITGFHPVTEIFAQLQQNAHCQKLNEYYTSYQRIAEDLQKDACNQPLIKDLIPNAPCCTQFEDDKQWYRCLIKEVMQHPRKKKYVKVKFHYVDFGNDEMIKIHIKKHNVHCMKDEWLEVPMMALKCQLWSIKVNSDPDAEYKKFVRQMTKMNNKAVMVTIKEKVDDILFIDLIQSKGSEVVICDPLKQESALDAAEKLN